MPAAGRLARATGMASVTRRRLGGCVARDAGHVHCMTDTALESLSAAIDRIDPAFAHRAVGELSVALGALAVVAPSRTAALFGVRSIDKAVPLLVRMVGVRNATAGLRTLQAEGDDLDAALRAGLVFGVVDTLAVLLAVRKGVLSKSAALGALAVLGAVAVLGVAASHDD